MQTFKCKICGGSLTVVSKSRVAVCDYCGSKQILPLFSDESAQLLYDRGNSYLRQNEYDKAETIFNQLLALCPEDPEIYWDLVLCKYGVTFVQDPKTGKYIPTCNRTHYESILNDKNYQKVLQYANDEQTAYYRETAETINNIQKGILAVSKKEKPFDIFISYKETDNKGNRTKDSIAAQKLYEKLTESGYKVFFSRITLEDKIGTEYEPYIYAALYSSKVMLTVCSSKENIESPWVRNEWSRFLTLRQNDASKTLIPLYFDMPKSDLPDEFALLSSYDMKADGFELELLRGIKKLIPLPIMKAKRRKQIAKIIGITASVFCIAIIAVTAIFLPGYLEEKQQAEDYAKAIEMFENADYEGASKIFTELSDYKDSVEMVKNCAIQPEYDKAIQLVYDSKYAEATWAFEALGDYKDSKEQKQIAETKWRESLATPAVACYSGSSGYGSYYVSSNGSVESFSNDIGSLHTDFKIGEHGKAVSVGHVSGKLNVLYEDGTLCLENSSSSSAKNIIQITSGAYCFALQKNGAVLSSEKIGGAEFDNEDIIWSKPISDWNNIVKLSYCVDSSALFGFGGFCLIGIRSDGSLEWAILDSSHKSTSEKASEYLSSLENIKDISVVIYSGEETSVDCIGISALDINNTLYIWSEANTGKEDPYSSLKILNKTYEETYENIDILDFSIKINNNYDTNSNVWEYTIGLYVIDSDKTLRMFNNEKATYADVVYIVDNVAGDLFSITQSGNIIQAEKSTECKTKVHDVWLEGK